MKGGYKMSRWPWFDDESIEIEGVTPGHVVINGNPIPIRDVVNTGISHYQCPARPAEAKEPEKYKV